MATIHRWKIWPLQANCIEFLPETFLLWQQQYNALILVQYCTLQNWITDSCIAFSSSVLHSCSNWRWDRDGWSRLPTCKGCFPLAIYVPLPSCPNMRSQVQNCDSKGIWHIISKGAFILSGFLHESKTVFSVIFVRQNTGPNLLRIHCNWMLIFMPLRGYLNSPSGATQTV